MRSGCDARGLSTCRSVRSYAGIDANRPLPSLPSVQPVTTIY